MNHALIMHVKLYSYANSVLITHIKLSYSCANSVLIMHVKLSYSCANRVCKVSLNSPGPTPWP